MPFWRTRHLFPNHRGVDTARDSHAHVREPVLAHVVVGPEHEGLPELGSRIEHLDESGLDRDPGSGSRRRDRDPRVGLDRLAGRHGHIDQDEVLDESRRAGDDPTGRVENHRPTVEDQLILTADQVGVHDRYPSLGDAIAQHLLTKRVLAGPKG